MCDTKCRARANEVQQLVGKQRQQSMLSTAGAIPVRNDKGELSMEKVKVSRYVTGKRPDYAPYRSSSDDGEGSSEDDEGFVGRHKQPAAAPHYESDDQEEMEEEVENICDLKTNDPRWNRLNQLVNSAFRGKNTFDRVLDENETHARRRRHEESDSDSNAEEVVNEEEAELRRACIRNRLLKKQEEEKLWAARDDDNNKNENVDDDEQSESEYEDITDSDEEDEACPKLKPVFVQKDERLTMIDKEDEIAKLEVAEQMQRKKQEARRKETLKMIEGEMQIERRKLGDSGNEGGTAWKQSDVNTDDEPDEAEYEAWKVRELKRIKRDREERAAYEKERMEIERMRNLTEHERRLERQLQPKQITNKAGKGSYRYLQKFYHRGSFYLDKEEDLLKRDVSEPTLEDCFDKTQFPSAMQVKNFGRNGRTKYTHLRDQDTSDFDSAWMGESHFNKKFHCEKAAGVKQHFEKPSLYKFKRND